MLPFALVKFLGQERRCRERLSSTLPRDDEAREFPVLVVGESFMMRSSMVWILAVVGKSYKVTGWFLTCFFKFSF